MQMKHKHRFRMTFISLYPENVPNVKVFTKNRNVLLFVPWTVVFRMMITWKVKRFYWNAKRFYTTNNIKASIYAKLFLFLSHKIKSYEKIICTMDACAPYNFVCCQERNPRRSNLIKRNLGISLGKF